MKTSVGIPEEVALSSWSPYLNIYHVHVLQSRAFLMLKLSISKPECTDKYDKQDLM